MRVVTFKLEDELIRALNKYAYERGLTRSEVIRRAIRSYLESNREIRTPRLRVWG